MIMKKDYNNILIIRTDRIGDVVLTTPAIKALRVAYPAAKISILVAPLTKCLVEKNSYLDEIIVDDRFGEHKDFLGFARLVSLIASKNFDLAIVLHTKKRINALCFLARIPVRVGYKNNKYGFLLTDPIVDVRHEGKKHETQYCLDVVKHLGVEVESDDLDLHVSIDESSERWVNDFFKTNEISEYGRVVAVHLGASDPARRWPQSLFAELVDKIAIKYNATILLVGSPDICEISRKVSSLAQEKVVDTTGKTTLSDLVSLVKRSHMLISNDSGPVHIAAALGVPVISIFTRNEPGINPERWCPLGKWSKVVSVLPQIAKKVKKDEGLSFQKAKVTDGKYMELITVKEVLEAVDALFKLC